MIALDTNILVHAHRREASLHVEAAGCLKKIAESSTLWGICFHSLVEFYGIVTHPKIWSESSTPQEAGDQIEAWKESPSLRILTESPRELDSLLDLARSSKVLGPMIHDARIANCCLFHGVSELWTVDRDFSRFPKLKTRNPLV